MSQHSQWNLWTGASEQLIIGKDGKLAGLLSINDVVLHAGEARGEIPYEDVISTFKAVCKHSKTSQAVVA